MKGFEKILRGILKYRLTDKALMEKRFQVIKNNPSPTSLFITCMDSRILTSRFATLDVGDSFILRNAGNFIPPAESVSFDSMTTEPAALELACLSNVRHVFVCGHSDCKAINMLYKLKDECHDHNHCGGPLQMWIKKYGTPSVQKFSEFVKDNENHIGPVPFNGRFSQLNFQAYIDPENKFSIEDKLSQLNSLQQLHHVAGFPFVQDKLLKGQMRIHAMWFDVYSGDVYLFSLNNKRFIEITEKSYKELMQECYPAD